MASEQAASQKKAIATDWKTLRLLLGILAGYTIVNLVLRGISGRVPASMVAMWRLFPLCLYATAMLLRSSERQTLASLRLSAREWAKVFLGLVLGGVSSYVVGNTLFQVAIAQTGVGVAVPAAQGGVIWAGLLAGALWFREKPSQARIAGAVIMVVGIAVLSWRPGASGASALSTGLVYAVLAGCAWSLSGVMLRFAYKHGLTPHAGQVISTWAAFIILWYTTASTQGSVLATSTTPPAVLLQMLLVGVVNAATLTFTALALRRTEVAVVNMFSAGSLALSTLGGVWFYGEPWSGMIALGLVLTLGGLVVANAAKKQ